MNAITALARLQALGVPAVTTSDAASVLGLTVSATGQTLRRLSASGLLTPVRKGLWAFGRDPDPRVLAEYVTSPHPCYLSLQTALYLRGLVGQVPEAVFVVSLARSSRIRTAVGVYSVHHVQPEFFGGFDSVGPSGLKLATAEKALVDFLYLSPARSRLFATLPEVELPRGFRRGAARDWALRVPTPRLRTLVERRLDEVFLQARTATSGWSVPSSHSTP